MQRDGEHAAASGKKGVTPRSCHDSFQDMLQSTHCNLVLAFELLMYAAGPAVALLIYDAYRPQRTIDVYADKVLELQTMFRRRS
jgi:hypothetical protein